MFVLGHLGIGSKLVSPWTDGLRRRWVLLGTLLPDLIDKPLYYGLVLATGRQGAALGLISGTRTFGHTALFLLAVTLAAIARRSRFFAALALGMATHLLLDNLGDHFGPPRPDQFGTLDALFFPYYGLHFPIHPFDTPRDHLASFAGNNYIIGGEIVGAMLLAWDYWKSVNRAEILSLLQLRRLRARKVWRRRRRSH